MLPSHRLVDWTDSTAQSPCPTPRGSNHVVLAVALRPGAQSSFLPALKIVFFFHSWLVLAFLCVVSWKCSTHEAELNHSSRAGMWCLWYKICTGTRRTERKGEEPGKAEKFVLAKQDESGTQ